MIERLRGQVTKQQILARIFEIDGLGTFLEKKERLQFRRGAAGDVRQWNGRMAAGVEREVRNAEDARSALIQDTKSNVLILNGSYSIFKNI